MDTLEEGPPSAETVPELIVKVPGEKESRYGLAGAITRIGRAPDSDIALSHPSVSGRHAEIHHQEGVHRLVDLRSSNGTKVNGKQISEATLRDGDEVKFGAVQALFRVPGSSSTGGFFAAARHFGQRITKSRFLAVSTVIHAVIVILLGRAALFPRTTEPAAFVSSETTFLIQEKSEQPGKSGEESASATGTPEFKPEVQPIMSGVEISKVAQVIATSAVTAISVRTGAPAPSSGAASSSIMKTLRGSGGPGKGFGKGFGQGSGLGQGIGEWIGTGGIGISGRGKTLKTVNEFYCYFVIHSGDWYAALDWRKPTAAARQTEPSSPGHPDEANISWYMTTPMPGIGPFITYKDCYGFMPRPNRPGEKDDNRGGCMEFTPGAMSNLLRFIRVASNNNIKGGSKPKAVVLDRKLVPYTYEKVTNQLTWNPEERENLRETLRKALPVGGRFGDVHGYLWNPQPADKVQSDFLIEYLLDVKPMPPFIYFTGNDDFTLNDAEVETLNDYIRRGGAIWGDCGFAGHRSKFDVAFRREMKRVIPDDDKPFKELPRNSTLFVRGDDAYFDLPQLPTGMQYYEAPVQVIEVTPGVVSVVLTKNAYGNFLRYELTMVNNQFQMGGELGRGRWVNKMWEYRDEFFRGLSDETVMSSYSLGSNVLVYMLGRWPAVLNRLENR